MTHCDYNIIFTDNGHKLYKIQEQLEKFQENGGIGYSTKEAEVLLNHNEKYKRIVNLTPELEEMKNNLIQYLLDLRKDYGYKPEIIDPNLYKIKFWQKIPENN